MVQMALVQSHIATGIWSLLIDIRKQGDCETRWLLMGFHDVRYGSIVIYLYIYGDLYGS